jgi:hypothetical protein
LGEVFSVRSAPRLYNEEQLGLRESLEAAERRVGVVVRRKFPASKDVNTEADEAAALGAVTRRQPMKIQQTEMTCKLYKHDICKQGRRCLRFPTETSRGPL